MLFQLLGFDVVYGSSVSTYNFAKYKSSRLSVQSP
jgi:hypothetical protein